MGIFVQYEELKSLSPKNALATLVRSRKTTTLSDLKIYDLIYDGERAVEKGCGVYLFFSQDNRCLLVGKNSASSFVERIPWHFSLKNDAWMNFLVKRTRERGNLNANSEAANALGGCRLLLIEVDRTSEPPETIEALEKCLRIFAAPTLNAYKKDTYQQEYSSALQKGTFQEAVQEVWRIHRQIYPKKKKS